MPPRRHTIITRTRPSATYRGPERSGGPSHPPKADTPSPKERGGLKSLAGPDQSTNAMYFSKPPPPPNIACSTY
ncbi:hypothetical protein PG996_013158 [Apiospora saccharicola]|uniref:Uncharacterized protein n=1 Tax=Apiospora saccharicola TaxID=335842 RepID=A0ABR1U589_9PEZI